MNARDDRPHDPELERALRSLERPEARPAFRAELRDRFVGAQPAAAASAAAPARRHRVGWLGAALLAAAAVIVFFVLRRPTTSVWRVLDGTGSSGAVIVDGRRFDVADRAALAAALLSAREVETLDAPLRALVRGEIAIELGPRTRLVQMHFAAAGAYALTTEVGSLRVATGPGFRGRGLHVRTPDLEFDVTGTQFAVDVEPAGSCVCCREGQIRVKPRTAPAARPVEAGAMCYASHAGAAPLWGPAIGAHVQPLHDLRVP